MPNYDVLHLKFALISDSKLQQMSKKDQSVLMSRLCTVITEAMNSQRLFPIHPDISAKILLAKLILRNVSPPDLSKFRSTIRFVENSLISTGFFPKNAKEIYVTGGLIVQRQKVTDALKDNQIVVVRYMPRDLISFP